MLEAIISFLPTEGNGAIGALDWSSEDRKKLAVESQTFCCPVCGMARDLLKESLGGDESPDAQIAEQISQLHMHNVSDSPQAGVRKMSSVSDSGVDNGGGVRGGGVSGGGSTKGTPSTPARSSRADEAGSSTGEGAATPDTNADPGILNLAMNADGELEEVFDVAESTFTEREQEGKAALNRVLIAAQYTSALIVILLLVRRVLKHALFFGTDGTGGASESWDL
jgi:hypothetical protein